MGRKRKVTLEDESDEPDKQGPQEEQNPYELKRQRMCVPRHVPGCHILAWPSDNQAAPCSKVCASLHTLVMQWSLAANVGHKRRDANCL